MGTREKDLGVTAGSLLLLDLGYYIPFLVITLEDSTNPLKYSTVPLRGLNPSQPL